MKSLINIGQEILLRGTQTINESGHLSIGGCDVCELSSLSPYPIYVLDEVHLRHSMHAYVHALETFYPKESLAYYASKAMINKALCVIVDQEKMGLDVSSGGELYTAIQAGFPAERILFHGNNKSEEELIMALEYNIGHIIVDNLGEIQLLDHLTKGQKFSVSILLRVKPGVHADTHNYMMTGSENSKFGFSISDGSVVKAIHIIAKNKNMRFKGLHCHIGSQILNLAGFEKAIEVMADFCADLKEQAIAVEELNLGGGLGIQNTPDVKPLPISDFIKCISGKVVNEFQTRKLPLPKLFVEPGRSIVAEAGITIYKIGSIKEIAGGWTFAAVNGGMADNMRPCLYGANYSALIANKALEDKTTKVKIVGKCCEEGDVLIQELVLPKPCYGDVLAVFATGAYNYSMASNYNRLPVPGVLLVKEGCFNWIVKPQDLKDIVRNDIVPIALSKA